MSVAITEEMGRPVQKHSSCLCLLYRKSAGTLDTCAVSTFDTQLVAMLTIPDCRVATGIAAYLACRLC